MAWGQKKRTRRRFGKALFVILFFALILSLFIYDSNTRIVTEEFPVTSARLPDGFNGFRIVQLSDLHGSTFGKDNSELIAAVSKAKPDIITITGDLIENSKSGEWARSLLLKLTAIAPVYFVSGNHEWASGGLVELFQIINECGVKALRNEYLVLNKGGSSIVLAGVDDPNGFADQKTPQQLFNEIHKDQPNKYTVLLAHRNTMLNTYSAIGTDLVLTGHGHGGIIRIPFAGGLISTEGTLFPKDESGFYINGNTVMFVSRGLGGIWHIPRFLNNPQVAVLILKK